MIYLEQLKAFTMEYLDPLGIWISLILAIPIFWTWLILLRQKQQTKKIWHQARQSTGKEPAILIIDMLPGKDISSNVRQFLNTDDTFKNIPENRIITLCWENELKPNEMYNFAKELRGAISKIYQTGADRIHLFFGGPHTAASVIGSELSNNIPTTLYQYNVVNGKYVNYGPLKTVI